MMIDEESKQRQETAKDTYIQDVNTVNKILKPAILYYHSGIWYNINADSPYLTNAGRHPRNV